MGEHTGQLTGDAMKTYVLRVVVEKDEDGWLAYCPALVESGVATWGQTEEEAIKNIQEIAEMVLADMIECQDPIPEGPDEDIHISLERRVVVNV